MLQYKGGRFYAPGVSFVLPEGFYLETEPDCGYQYGLGAWTPDREFYFEWQAEQGCHGTERELAELFCPAWSRRDPLDEITEVRVNGLSGHQAIYESESWEYLEIRLALGDGAEFSVQVRARKGTVRGEALRAYLAAVCEGIRQEKQ